MGLPESSVGVLVAFVAEKSLADKAGIRKGDIILVANNKPMVSLKDFNTVFGENSKTMLLLIRRAGGQFYTVLEK